MPTQNATFQVSSSLHRLAGRIGLDRENRDAADDQRPRDRRHGLGQLQPQLLGDEAADHGDDERRRQLVTDSRDCPAA